MNIRFPTRASMFVGASLVVFGASAFVDAGTVIAAPLDHPVVGSGPSLKCNDSALTGLPFWRGPLSSMMSLTFAHAPGHPAGGV